MYKKNKQIEKVEITQEELPVSTQNENASLKSNEQKIDNMDNKLDTNIDDEEEEIDNRTCFQKTCGKMGPGSMRGCIFNLCILSLGTGSLALPQKIGYISLVASPIVILVSGAINY